MTGLLSAFGMHGVAFRERDTARLARLRREMQAAGLDALVLRLPENVLYTTGFWPLNGFVAALFPLSGNVTIVVPAGEEELATGAWVDEVRSYAPGSLDQLTSPDDRIAATIAEIGRDQHLDRSALGYEGSFELVATGHWEGEVRLPSTAALAALQRAFPEASWRDATAALRRSRIVKSQQELAALQVATDVAGRGLAAAREVIRPGVTEIDVAVAVESAIYRASGTTVRGRRVERARGYASVMSGPNAARACLHYNLSTPRRLERGDLVSIELGAYADGYWTDLTRVYTVGDPDQRQREVFQIVREAQLAAFAAMRPGATCAAIDRAARDVIARAGHAAGFPHHLGHSTGLQWHEPPALHPLSDHMVEAGEVYTVEPGIYLEGWGGIRLEDLVAVRASGLAAEVMSDAIPRDLAVP